MRRSTGEQEGWCLGRPCREDGSTVTHEGRRKRCQDRRRVQVGRMVETVSAEDGDGRGRRTVAGLAVTGRVAIGQGFRRISVRLG